MAISNLKLILIHSLIYLVFNSSNCYGFNNNKPLVTNVENEKLLNITADNLTINKLNNTNLFTGNVNLNYNTINIKTEQILIYYNLNDKTEQNNLNKLKKIIIITPFVMTKKMIDNGREVIEEISADYAEYIVIDKKLKFNNNVKITRDKMTVICKYFEMYIDISELNHKS